MALDIHKQPVKVGVEDSGVSKKDQLVEMFISSLMFTESPYWNNPMVL